MKRAACFLMAMWMCAAVEGMVVRPAPNFAVAGVKANSSLKSFRGQTVVLVIARSAREKHFRDELARLKYVYGQLANEKVVFVAALEDGGGEIRSDIPFVTAADPEQVASDYGVTGPFAIAVIGTDGNLDLITAKPVNGERVKDMVFDAYDRQVAARAQAEGQ